jgi:hypothetical protein
MQRIDQNPALSVFTRMQAFFIKLATLVRQMPHESKQENKTATTASSALQMSLLSFIATHFSENIKTYTTAFLSQKFADVNSEFLIAAINANTKLSISQKSTITDILSTVPSRDDYNIYR